MDIKPLPGLNDVSDAVLGRPKLKEINFYNGNKIYYEPNRYKDLSEFFSRYMGVFENYINVARPVYESSVTRFNYISSLDYFSDNLEALPNTRNQI